MTNDRQNQLDGFTNGVHVCAASGCKTLTLSRFCHTHRPRGAWAIAANMREEHTTRAATATATLDVVQGDQVAGDAATRNLTRLGDQ